MNFGSLQTQTCMVLGRDEMGAKFNSFSRHNGISVSNAKLQKTKTENPAPKLQEQYKALRTKYQFARARFQLSSNILI